MNSTMLFGRRSSFALALLAAVALPPAASEDAPTDAQVIASARSAAPTEVAKDATIMAMEAGGKMRTVRQGHNGFTCIPDSPSTPGPDPMCMDANGLAWARAWAGHEPPPAGKIGFMYMLQGGTDASNTDPYATEPNSGNHWVKTGAHVMVVGADAAFYDQYPKSADPNTKMPYVMWAGTPYQHLMVPVQ